MTTTAQPGTVARAPRRALVLGATGFLGRHVSGAFRATGTHVVGVSRSIAVGDGAGAVDDAVRLDLTEASRADLAALITSAHADVVVNASGVVWQGDEPGMRRLNTDLVERLAQAVADVAHRPLVVQLGTVHEYGPAPEGSAVTEDFGGEPPTVYGRTKLAGAELLLRAAREHGLSAAVLRLVNVCGPGTPTESLLGMVGARLAALERTPPVEPAVLRLSPLDARRDYIDVRDVAAAVLAVAARPETAEKGRIFNVGRAEAVPVRDLVHTLLECSPARVRVEEAAGSTVLRTRAQWQRTDISRARTELAWQPEHTLRRSLEDLLAAASQQPIH